MDDTTENRHMALSTGLDIAFAAQADEAAVWLPTDRFCVRKVSAVQATGAFWLYADVVPWDHPYWPHTYDTDIHLYRSTDARRWDYLGPVVTHAPESSAWDRGGVGSPGAVAWEGRVYVFYAGKENRDGRTGRRALGLAVADHPAGPFRKLPAPILRPVDDRSHLDDPCPVGAADGRGIELYYRQADHHLPAPNYAIHRTCSAAPVSSWSPPVVILCADAFIRAYESAAAMRLGSTVVLANFEHFSAGGYKTGIQVSSDGLSFAPGPDRYLEDSLCAGWAIPRCGLQPAFIPSADGACRHLGIARPVDAAGHYNQRIYPIMPLR